MKKIKGPFKCPVCEWNNTVSVKKPGPFEPSTLFVRCTTCYCQHRAQFVWKGKQGVQINSKVEILSELGLQMIMEDPALFEKLRTPFLAREVLTRYRKNGESIGFLVAAGKETPLHEASDEECMKAALAVIKAHSEEVNKSEEAVT